MALACLVELVDVNRKMAELQSLNFLHEISEENSSLVSGICELYQKYELCINNTVFVHSEGQRCAFNSPLNTLARSFSAKYFRTFPQLTGLISYFANFNLFLYQRITNPPFSASTSLQRPFITHGISGSDCRPFAANRLAHCCDKIMNAYRKSSIVQVYASPD